MNLFDEDEQDHENFDEQVFVIYLGYSVCQSCESEISTLSTFCSNCGFKNKTFNPEDFEKICGRSIEYIQEHCCKERALRNGQERYCNNCGTETVLDQTAREQEVNYLLKSLDW